MTIMKKHPNPMYVQTYRSVVNRRQSHHSSSTVIVIFALLPSSGHLRVLTCVSLRSTGHICSMDTCLWLSSWVRACVCRVYVRAPGSASLPP
eukprot:15199-Eustigmatos_ZCMA.PRE.1